MRKFFPLVTLSLLVLVAGCSTRSISDSGYDSGGSYGRSDNAFYRGELSEFDVLGIDRGAKPSDDDIARALATREQLFLKRGSTIMLIQSGALMPDDPMTKALEKYYSVVSFTGIPNDKAAAGTASESAESYSRSLRFAAARSGCEKILVYWGTLESARENLATSSVSWVPIVGWVLPDEHQRMRIRLKIVLVDVRTGQWEMYTPEPIDDRSLSSLISRRDTDQTLVATLKDKAYVAAADDIQKRFGR
jgi:hypothetical protein